MTTYIAKRLKGFYTVHVHAMEIVITKSVEENGI